MKNILILCTGNSCRSQIAHGYLQHFLENRANIYSAGVETHGVNPTAVEVMKCDDIDISHHSSNHVDEYSEIDFDFVITVCDHAKEQCPYIPTSGVQLHHNFPDPAKATGTQEEKKEVFVSVRNAIKSYCQKFGFEYFSVPVKDSEF